MDIKNSIKKLFTADEEWQGQVSKTNKKPTIKVNYNVPTGSELRIYQSPVGYTWTHDSFIVSGFGSREVGVNGSHYYVWFKSGDDASATLSTYLQETINDEFAVSVVGMNFDEDGKLLVSGTGGATGGDASQALQQEQIDIASASNAAIFQQLADQTDRLLYDTDVIANNITNSNLAQWSQLDTIREASEISSAYLQGILNKSTALEHSTSLYLLPAATTLAPDTNPTYQQPPEQFKLDAGWYWKNLSAGQASQLYYFSYLGLDLQVPAAQTTYSIGDITGGWAVMRILNLKSTGAIPFLVKYSVPTGLGDVEPWHKSKWIYTIPTAAKLNVGQEYLFYWGVQPDPRFYPETERIELELSSTSGSAQNTEQLAYLTLNTSSSAQANHSEYIVRAAGWIFGAQHISELVFSSEPQSLTFTAGDASATLQQEQIDTLTASNLAVCQRLENSNVVLGSMDISLNNMEVKLDYLTFTGSNLKVQDAKLSSELSSLNSVIQQGVYINMETTPPLSGGVKLSGSTDANLFVYDAASNTTLGLVNSELTSLNGVFTDLLSGNSQMYVKIDGSDDSIQILGIDSTSLAPSAIYTVDNSAKVYVDNVVNSLLLAKNSVNNNVNLLVDNEQRLLSNTVIFGTVPVSGTFWQETQPVSIDGTVAVSGTFWQETQPVSIDGTVPISSGEPLDCHVYGSSDGTAWHHIKTNPNGVVATNAIMETGAGALTSTAVSGTETYNALDTVIKNSTLQTVLRTNDNGQLTSTLSGTGNSVHSLDVAVKNSVSVQNTNSTPLVISPRTAVWTQVATNVPSVGPNTQIGTMIDTDGYSYIWVYITAGTVTTMGNVYAEFSPDGITWIRSYYNAYFNPGSNQTATISIGNSVPLKYYRLYTDGSVFLATVNAYFAMK